MTTTALYRDHLATMDGMLGDALERAGKAGLALDGVLFHAGRESYYHADDQPHPFWVNPHFRRWTPLYGAEHAVLARPGKKPLVIRVQPKDYWYDTSPAPTSYWGEAVDLAEVEKFADLTTATGPLGRVAYVGNSKAAAAEVGIPEERVEPAALMAPLDWHRAVKTPWEVALLEKAAERGASGHLAGKRAWEAGASEREVFFAFLAAADQMLEELAFPSIVALDGKAAILHYQHKRGRGETPGKLLLLDAGANFCGYASDLTRTWLAAGEHAVMRALIEGLDAFERRLCEMVRPGLPYPEIHFAAHRFTAELLCELGILTATPEEALALRLTSSFFPHGVGHQLGIQVHDVGGRQATPEGGTNPPPEGHPYLRNTRTLEPGHYVTIEPGIYFIPMLLEPLKAKPEGAKVNWQLVEELSPYGGARIEDNVLCTTTGGRDLSRPLLPGPRGE